MKYLDEDGLAHLISTLKSSIRIVETSDTYTTTDVEQITFTVPTYTTDGRSTLDIYVNGIKVMPDIDYTLSGNVVSLNKVLNAGQTVMFIVRTISI